MMDDNTPIALAISYERALEHNEQYPIDSIYLAAFAVDEEHQGKGLGMQLLHTWLTENTRIGFLHFTSPLSFSVQTNSADWNLHVQRMYEKIGFERRAQKTYDNRVDFVFGYTPQN